MMEEKRGKRGCQAHAMTARKAMHEAMAERGNERMSMVFGGAHSPWPRLARNSYGEPLIPPSPRAWRAEPAPASWPSGWGIMPGEQRVLPGHV